MNQIIQNLQYGDFCLEDFEVDFPNDSSTLAQIIFIAYPDYNFIIYEEYPSMGLGAMIPFGESKGKKILKTQEKPGEYKNSETRTHENIDVCISRITEWTKNIREDLIHSKNLLRTTIDDFTEKFQKQIDENIKNPEAYFNVDEKEEIINRLDALQKRINELEEKFNLSKEDTKNIEVAIKKSKDNIDVYPKGVWYKTAGNKILNALKKTLSTKEGREALLEITKKMLTM